jgi:2'-5' RNA ligase
VITAVVCAAFDPPTDDAIYAVRERVRRLGVEMPDRPPHRPHLSMVAARIEQGAELQRVTELAAEVASRHEPIPVVLAEVGGFGRAGALWLAPAPTPALAALQRDAYRSLDAAGFESAFGERSTPTLWVPHCTLATRLPKPRLRELEAAIKDGYEPVQGRVDAVATILVGGRGDTSHAVLTGRLAG